jgi:hypothetical protein
MAKSLDRALSATTDTAPRRALRRIHEGSRRKLAGHGFVILREIYFVPFVVMLYLELSQTKKAHPRRSGRRK